MIKVKRLEWREYKALAGLVKTVALDCFGNEFARIDMPLNDIHQVTIDEIQLRYDAIILNNIIVSKPFRDENFQWPAGPFSLGDRVRKRSGSSWQGHIVGFYSTTLTPIGYAVESEREKGAVQIYQASALEKVSEE